MNATRDLIAAALTLADEVDDLYENAPVEQNSNEIRELCARAMVQPAAPDMAEVRRLVRLLESCTNWAAIEVEDEDSRRIWLEEQKIVRTALLDYVRGIMAERDQFRDAAKMVSAALQPVSAAEVPMPEPDTHCYDDDVGRDVWSHSPEQMRTYGDAREAAGYAAGVAAGGKDAEPAAYLYTLEYGKTVADTKVSLRQLNYPFGVCGVDYLARYDDGVSYVRQTPL